jgi:hypothetical protein
MKHVYDKKFNFVTENKVETNDLSGWVDKDTSVILEKVEKIEEKSAIFEKKNDLFIFKNVEFSVLCEESKLQRTSPQPVQLAMHKSCLAPLDPILTHPVKDVQDMLRILHILQQVNYYQFNTAN